MNIQEDYVSFEVAKLLKEKGFDEHCFCINYPLPEGEHNNIILPNLLNNSMIPFIDEYKFCRYKEDFITIPTLQMAMKWLREVHYKQCDVGYDIDLKWFIQIIDLKEPVEHNYPENATGFKSFEEACEASIKYCLENLI